PEVVPVLPLVALHERVERLRRMSGGVDVRVERGVVEARRRELERHAHPLRLRRPVRLAYRSTAMNRRRPSGIERMPTTSAGHTSGQSVATSAPSISAARMPRMTYVAGETTESTCIHAGSTLTG